MKQLLVTLIVFAVSWTAASAAALMEKLVSEGRSTPGPAQKNDVRVNWKRFLKTAAKASQDQRKSAP